MNQKEVNRLLEQARVDFSSSYPSAEQHDALWRVVKALVEGKIESLGVVFEGKIESLGVVFDGEKRGKSGSGLEAD